MTPTQFPTDPLLALRLAPPPLRATLVPRPHLLAALERGLLVPLTLVAAPPGFGKTTLLSTWAARLVADQALVWVSLEADDDDPLRFLATMLAGLDTALGGSATPLLAQIRTPQPPPIMHLLPALLQLLGAHPQPLVVVLDDYHVIETPSIHQALLFIVEHLPPHVHVVLATRTDPPLPLGRLRARNQIIEVRADDLRFQEDEAAQFLTGVMGLPLSDDDVAALEQRTEGWPAGLQLAAISLRNQRDPHAFVAAFSGSHRYIVDYLADEVLVRLPQETQSFLLQTSIVDHLYGPLCDALSGQHNGQAMLAQLEHGQLFLVPLDAERRWYRYHTLFGDLLRYRLHQLAPDTLPTLHRRAATWYADNGMIEEAIQHAIAGDASDLAAAWIRDVLDTMRNSGQVAKLVRWLAALPEATLRADSRLLLGYAWCLFYTGQLAAAERHLNHADQSIGHDAPAADIAQITALRAHLARVSGDLPAALALSTRALELSPGDDSALRSFILLNQAGVSRLTGDLCAAERGYAEASELYRHSENDYMLAVTGCLQAEIQAQQGALHRAAATYTRVLEESRIGGVPGPASGLAAAGLAQVHYAWNDLPVAERNLSVALSQAHQIGDIDTLLTGLRTQALLHAARGERGDAEQALAQLDIIIQRSGNAMLQATLSALRVRIALCCPDADLAAALVWARGVQPTLLPPLSAPASMLTLTVLRVLIAAGAAMGDRQLLDEALAKLHALRALASEAKQDVTIIETLVLEALAQAGLHAIPAALRVLAQALDMAEPHSQIRLFVDLGAGLVPLLQRVPVSNERQQAYLHRLLAAFGMAARSEVPYTALQPAQLIEPLSPREREVLGLLAQGLSNEAIARTLVVSIATVKKHATSIFAKLGASSRTEAVVRARELGMLP